MLRDPKYDWHLEAGAEKETWILYQSEKKQRVRTYMLKASTVEKECKN